MKLMYNLYVSEKFNGFSDDKRDIMICDRNFSSLRGACSLIINLFGVSLFDSEYIMGEDCFTTSFAIDDPCYPDDNPSIFITIKAFIAEDNVDSDSYNTEDILYKLCERFDVRR